MSNSRYIAFFLPTALLFILAAAPALASFSLANSPGDCETEYSVSTHVEKNDNIYEVNEYTESDTLSIWSLGAEAGCEHYDGTEYEISFSFDDYRFTDHSMEDYDETEAAFEYRREVSSKAWLEFEAERERTSMDFIDALYELPGHNHEIQLTYGRTIDQKSSFELTWRTEDNNYDNLETSNSETSSWEAVYTRETGVFSYLEFSYEKSRADYPNDFLYAFSEAEQTIVDTGIPREDTTESFSVT